MCWSLLLFIIFIKLLISMLNLITNTWSLILLLGAIWLAHPQQFNDFKSEMERKVKEISDSMAEVYQYRCQDFYKSCEVRAYVECEGTSQRKCYDDFPKHQTCLDGGAYMGQEPGIIFPPNINKESLERATEKGEEALFICASGGVDERLKSLDNGRDKRYGLAYIGSTFGIMKRYPSLMAECRDYDPRYRSWYVAATTGRKNVIIIMDTSRSMERNSRMSKAKDAVESVINTLNNGDFFGVIKFGDTASTVKYQKITRATNSAKSKVISRVKDIQPSGTTNYVAAFEKAFEMMAKAGNRATSGVQNIILFMTDGRPNGSNNITELQEYIDEQDQKYHINLFTYAIGDDDEVNTTLLKEFSCRYSGIMFEISGSSSRSNLAEIMREYYIYLSEGVSIDSPVWTEPYEDAFGFGRMVTVAYPIYYSNASNPGIRIILGVAGIDVTLESLERFGLTEDQITDRLLDDFPLFFNNLTECQLENLRPDYSKCQVESCGETSQGIDSPCEGEPATKLFYSTIDTTDRICCGLTIIQFIIIMVVVGAVLIAAIVTAICCYRRKRMQDQFRPKPEQIEEQPNSKQDVNHLQHVLKQKSMTDDQIQKMNMY